LIGRGPPYPNTHDFNADPAGRAAIDAVDYPEIEAEFDRLFDTTRDALIRLYLLPAPGPAELAIKLTLFEQEEDWRINRADEIIRRIVSDARRFGQLGPFPQSDEKLLSGFAEYRAALNLATVGASSQEEDDTIDPRMRKAPRARLHQQPHDHRHAVRKACAGGP